MADGINVVNIRDYTDDELKTIVRFLWDATTGTADWDKAVTFAELGSVVCDEVKRREL